MSVLEIKDLHVSIEDKEILKGVNLTLKTGEIAAIMGPTTLSAAIMGNQIMRLLRANFCLTVKISLNSKLTNVHVLGFFLLCNTHLKFQELPMLNLSVQL